METLIEEMNTLNSIIADAVALPTDLLAIVTSMTTQLDTLSEAAMFVLPKIEVPVVSPYPVRQIPERHISLAPEIQIQPAAGTKTPVKLTTGVNWADLNLEFENETSLAVFYGKKHIGTYDHIRLGFVRKNTKDQKPDKQWKMLLQLSVISQLPKDVRPTVNTLRNGLDTSAEAFYKIKQSLTKKLQNAFGITDDPFCPYNEVMGYQLKFTLKSIAILRGSGELHRSGGKLFDEKIGEEDSELEDLNDAY